MREGSGKTVVGRRGRRDNGEGWGRKGPVGGIRRGFSGVESDDSVEKDTTVGRTCAGVLGFLRGGYGGEEGRQPKMWRSSILGPTTSKMAAMAASSWRYEIRPSQMLILESCRIPISWTGSTHGIPQDFVLLHQTL